MDEAEWLAYECPLPMLIFLRGQPPAEQKVPFVPRICSGYGDLDYGPGQHMSARKCRLFILACLQRLHGLDLDEPSGQALAAYQRYALEGAPRDEFFQACLRIQDAAVSSGGTALVSHLAAAMWTDDPAGAANAAMDIACTVANVKAKDSVAVTCAEATEDDWFAWSFCGGPPDPLWQATRTAEERFQAGVLREVVPNPFLPVALDPTWRTPIVVALARAAYDERLLQSGQLAPDRLAVLADALEDAGCTDAETLSHLRGPSGPHVRGCWVIDLLLGKE
jgi:hypothetical protein